jgi:hypothetical protein
VVPAAAEVAGEVELLVETTETVGGCPWCGVVAKPHGRRQLFQHQRDATQATALLLSYSPECTDDRNVPRTY